MRRTVFSVMVLGAAMLLALGACNESSITGTYGSASIQGSVVLTGELAGVSAEGIRVSVPGTGIETRTDAEGRFVLAGLESGLTELEVSREDGIYDAISLAASEATKVTISIDARNSRSRGARHSGRSVRGSVVGSTPTSITVDTVNEGEIELLVDENTVIYKGAVKLLAEEVEAGELIKAMAIETDEGLRATEIKVTPQHAGDDRFLPRSIVGTITEIGDDELTVVAENGTTKVVRVDSRTEYYTKNLVISFEDLEVDDRIKVFGMDRDDGMIAVWIRLKPGEGEDDDDEGEEEEELESVKGNVIEVGTGSITISTKKDGEVQILVNEDTAIKERGKAIELTEIDAGDEIVAHGEWVDASTFQASKITVVK